MAAPLEIKEDFRRLKWAGYYFVGLGVLFSLVWVLFLRAVPSSFADLMYLCLGPGMILIGVMASRLQQRSNVRLTISDDAVTFTPIGWNQSPVRLPMADIKAVSMIKGAIHNQNLRFDTKDQSYELLSGHLERESRDIINLISIRLENDGMHLVERMSDILGAPTGKWEVHEGIPYKEGPK